MQCYKMAFFLSLLFCPLLASAAGVAIAGTRVIYNEQSHEADITVKNTNPHDPVLIQSWVDDLADNNKSPFIVTPPLFRLDAGDSNDLRVLLTSAQLPNDRESLFTLNIKVIPANTYTVRDMLVPIFKDGKLVYDLPSLEEIRAYSEKELATIWDEIKRFVYPQEYYVDLSEKLLNLKLEMLKKYK